MRVIAAFLVLLSIANLSLGDYYVRTDGNDLHDGFTAETAWATLNHAQTILQNAPGNGTLFFGPGTFDLAINFNCNQNISGVYDVGSATTLKLTGSASITLLQDATISKLKILSSSSSPALKSTTNVGILIHSIDLEASPSNAMLFNQVSVEIVNSTFRGNGANTTGLSFIKVTNTDLTIDSSSFEHVNAYTRAAIHSTVAGNLVLRKTNFTNSAGEYSASIYTTGVSVEVSQCIFRNLLAWGAGTSAIYALTPPSIKIDHTEFDSCFSDNFPVVSIKTTSSAQITSNKFTNNQVLRSSTFRIDTCTSLVLSSNYFAYNYAYLASGFAVVDSTSVIENNIVQYSISTTTTTSVIGSSPIIQSPYFRIDFNDNIMIGNVLERPVQRGPDSLSIDLAFQGSLDIYLNGGAITSSLPEFAALSVAYSNLTIGKGSNNNDPEIHGFMGAGAKVHLSTPLVLDGIFRFLLFTTDYTAFYESYVYSRGYPIIAQGENINWLQSAYFFDTPLRLRNAHTVMCCDSFPEIPPELVNLQFHNSSITVQKDALLQFASGAKPLSFYGLDSFIRIEEDAEFIFLGAQQSSMQVANVFIDNGTMYATRETLYGDLTVGPAGKLELYPSTWKGVSQPLKVDGLTKITGTLRISDGMYLPPFPTFTYSDGPRDILISSMGYNITGSIVSPYDVKFEATELNSTSVRAVPKALFPYTTLASNLGAISVEFVVDPNVTIPSNCSSFLPSSAPGFDLTTLRCDHRNPTLLIISSSQLPAPGSIMLVDDPSGVFATSPNPIRVPPKPNSPVAIIRPIAAYRSCASVVLDGTLSTGLGSYPGSFEWSLLNSSDASAIPAFANFFASLPANSSIVPLPQSVFSPGEEYFLQLRVVNILGIASNASNPLFITASSNFFIPPIFLEGASQRTHYLGTDAVLTASIDFTSCSWDSNAARFQWVAVDPVSGTESALPLGETTRPSLIIPSSYFATQRAYAFRLYAFPSSALDMSSNVNSSAMVTLHVISRPLVAISTSRSMFVNETVSLSVETSISAQIAPLTYLWEVVACPVNYAQKWFPPQASLAGLIASPQDCVDSLGTPFAFPFTSTNTSQTTVGKGTLEPGSYIVRCTVSLADQSSTAVIPFTLLASTSTPPPIVKINLPSSINQLNAAWKIVLEASVDGNEGSAASRLYDLTWSSPFGQYTIPPETNGKSTLIIPAGTLKTNQNLFVQLSATPKSIAFPMKRDSSNVLMATPGVAIVQLPLAETPLGGQILVSPSLGVSLQTHFTISTSLWQTRYGPLKYQFSIVDTKNMERGEYREIPLTEMSDISSISNVTLYVPDGTSQDVEVILRVRDALGGRTEARTKVLVTAEVGNNRRDSKRDLTDSALLLLKQAQDASNWRVGYQIVDTFVTASNKTGVVLNETVREEIWNALIDLSYNVVPTEVNAGILLGQLRNIITVFPPGTASQATKILDVASDLLYSSYARYGTATVYAGYASEYLISLISLLMETGLIQPDGSDSLDPTWLVTSHGEMVWNSLVVGELPYKTETSGLKVSVAKVDTQLNSASVETLSSTVSTTFDPSVVSGLPEGYVGYSYSLYEDGTFPHLPQGAAFRRVVDIRFLGPTLKKSPLNLPHHLRRNAVSEITIGHRTIFTNISTVLLETETPACATWDESSRSWLTSGCTTSRGSGNEIQCDCSTGGSLSVLFELGSGGGPGSNAGSPKGGRSGLHPAAIAAIVILVLIIIGLAIFAVYHFRNNPLLRETLMPNESKRNANNKTRSSAVSPTSEVEMSRVASEPSAASEPDIAGRPSAASSPAWTRSKVPIQ